MCEYTCFTGWIWSRETDLLARATSLLSQGLDGRIKRLIGTSVASPVVAAAVVRLIESVTLESAVVNPASMKSALVQGCRPKT